ncbi:MAG: hypothetical protein H7A23_08505 [Leptospiraceae bacterium]|nr:hypothetical protein [Leptospiraceae bacterium]MCP5494586.1 hypothetical protein [Leptospiraceae bacterium]
MKRIKSLSVSDYPNLCNGHDFLQVLAFVFRENGNKSISEDIVGSSFRIAYDRKCFMKTNLYNNLDSFAKRKSWKLFKEEKV